MDRFKQLVQELNGQLEAGADPLVLRHTLALLLLELDRATGTAARTLGTAKVAVVMPQPHIQLDESTFSVAPTPVEVLPEPPVKTPRIAEVKKEKEKPKASPLVLFDEEFVVEPLASVQPQAAESNLYDVMEEVPTLYMHRGAELNERLQPAAPSLNDQLKQSATEQKDRLREGPIADLRKAIGVNERFQFIRELFRNDEAMYERSIKTINQFKIFPEADFWINRELKTKLGWPLDHSLVHQFDALIKRRFS